MARPDQRVDVSSSNRRQWLKALAAAGSAASLSALAGCSSEDPGSPDDGNGNGNGNGNDDGNGNGDDGSTDQMTVTISSTSEGTMGFTALNGYAQIMNDVGSRLQLRVEPASGNIESARLLARGDMPLATGTNGTIWSAANAEDMEGDFGSNPLPENRRPQQVLPWAELNFYFATTEDTGITDMSQESLEGKTIATGPVGATGTWTAPLKVAGIDLDSVELVSEEFGQTPTALREGRVDVIPAYTVSRATVPGWLQELTGDDSITIPTFTDEQLDALSGAYYSNVELAASDTWQADVGMDQIPTATTGYQTISTRHTSPEITYEYVKTLFDNQQRVQDFHAGLALFAPEFAVNNLVSSVPVHPGAVQYFEEEGVWDDSLTVGEVDDDPKFTF
ncbi:TAXI family TRAP transporter solute-binding subunit [Natronomonas marina]|uniref:TAXI family TRAP transporter solute-binding subunit n=1 Tax=Natronomonas marina TaxID=2961939 RepID=UPI0020CA1292|nr:TAXI family TRAP transporter solute-binding subunit [Natronomonas marina]